jgi:hypothetical protein
LSGLVYITYSPNPKTNACPWLFTSCHVCGIHHDKS